MSRTPNNLPILHKESAKLASSVHPIKCFVFVLLSTDSSITMKNGTILGISKPFSKRCYFTFRYWARKRYNHRSSWLDVGAWMNKNKGEKTLEEMGSKDRWSYRRKCNGQRAWCSEKKRPTLTNGRLMECSLFHTCKKDVESINTLEQCVTISSMF